jgi:hypothetical protein
MDVKRGPSQSAIRTGFECGRGRFFARCLAQGEWRIRKNDEVYKLYGELQLLVEVKKRRLQYVGHVVRMEEGRVPKKILDQHPGGRRKPGRPRKGSLDDVTKDLEVIRGWGGGYLGQERMGEIFRRGQGPSWTVARED